MAGKIADTVELLKDKVLSAPMYRTRVTRFVDTGKLLAKLSPGDIVIANASSAAIGLAPDSEREVEGVDCGKSLIRLKGGKHLLAEWFRPELWRRERVRTKVDIIAQRQLLDTFARSRWELFSHQIDQRIAKAQEEERKAEADVQHVRNVLAMRREVVAGLEASKAQDDVWPRVLTNKLMGLILSKVLACVELIQEGEQMVLIAYTGPIAVQVKDKPVQRGEYAIKIYPTGAPVRIRIENVAPGHQSTDVPYNENATGLCNVCFGDQRGEMQALVDDEDWVRLLTLIRVYLEGNRAGA